ncbi:MAG: hypothetical protein KF770_20270 [Anaerolineae bacterium]|nr:hypothetical protein [Anaerolineae bacterium]
MLLADITEEIKVLPRFEKLQLIEAISKMLLEEENPTRYFATEAVYPVFTPDNQEKAAAQLQQFLRQALS